MKIEIDFRPIQANNLAAKKVFWAIRLFPETNKEMQDLQRGIELHMAPIEYKMCPLGQELNYGIFFEEKPKLND